MDKWLPDTILIHLRDLHYEIGYEGKRRRRYVNQIRLQVENLKTGTVLRQIFLQDEELTKLQRSHYQRLTNAPTDPTTNQNQQRVTTLASWNVFSADYDTVSRICSKMINANSSPSSKIFTNVDCIHLVMKLLREVKMC